jgi:hypothetical protein
MGWYRRELGIVLSSPYPIFARRVFGRFQRRSRLACLADRIVVSSEKQKGAAAQRRLSMLITAKLLVGLRRRSPGPRKMGAFRNGRYVDKMDDTWTENRPSKRSVGYFRVE